MATHDEIAAALTKIYLFFIQIGYLLESEISWPCADDDRVNVAFCKSKGLDDAAIALIKAIPWPTNYCHLALNSGATNWSDDGDVEGSRYPANSLLNPEEGDEVEWIGSSEVPLTLSTQGESAGVVLLIDAKTGKMQHIAAIDFHWPDEPWHDAVEMLEAMYSEFISLEHLPVAGKVLSVADATHHQGRYYDKTKATLFDYGWPNNFRRDDFNRVIGSLWDQWDREVHEEYLRQDEEQRAAQEKLQALQIEESPTNIPPPS